MRRSPRRCRPRTRSSPTFTERRRITRLSAVLLLCLVLPGCADFTIVISTPAPTLNLIKLPPIGFNHRYGNSPVAAADGFALERKLFASHAFWEVAIEADPQAPGYVNAANKRAVMAARHSTQ